MNEAGDVGQQGVPFRCTDKDALIFRFEGKVTERAAAKTLEVLEKLFPDQTICLLPSHIALIGVVSETDLAG